MMHIAGTGKPIWISQPTEFECLTSKGSEKGKTSSDVTLSGMLISPDGSFCYFDSLNCVKEKVEVALENQVGMYYTHEGSAV